MSTLNPQTEAKSHEWMLKPAVYGLLGCVPLLWYGLFRGELDQIFATNVALLIGPLAALPFIFLLALAGRNRSDRSVQIGVLTLIPCLLLGNVLDLLTLWNGTADELSLGGLLNVEQLSGSGRSWCLYLAAIAFSRRPYARPRYSSWLAPGALLIVLAGLQIFNSQSNDQHLLAALSGMIALFSAILLLRAAQHEKSVLMLALTGTALLQAVNHLLYLLPSTQSFAFILLQNCNDVAGFYLVVPSLLAAISRQSIGPSQTLSVEQQGLAYAEGLKQARGEIFSRLSHELRTPLNAIIGYSELLQDDLPPAATSQSHEDVRKINRAGWDMIHLVDSMLDLAATQHSTLSLRETHFDSERFCQLVERTARPLTAAALSSFKVHCPAGFGPLYTDENRLLQICMNLIRNSLRYTRDGHIALHLYPVRHNGKSSIEIDIRDSGQGMKPSELASLHEAMARTPASNQRIDDLDRLSLMIPLTHHLCKLIGGSLSIESCSGLGTTYRLNFPDQLAASRNSRKKSALSPHRVLLLESSARGNEEVIEILNHSGLEVFRVRQPSSGLRLLYEVNPDLIIADARDWNDDKLGLLDNVQWKDPACHVVVLHGSAEQGRRAEVLKMEHSTALKEIEQFCAHCRIEAK